VNQCTGREVTGLLRRKLFLADFESMEGAAVALVGKLQGIPVSELRSISNFASTRDMQASSMALALGNLGDYMAGWLGRAA
jgi:nucleoside phosphorylase